VRRVTERNAGRQTAGEDGEVALTPKAKAELVLRVQHSREPFKALPVRRVYIPKPGGKKRPLGIPVITDRVHQARVVNALEPEWEARFEPKSYGFRPGRGCHDAIEAIFHVAKQNPRRLWVLDADLAGASPDDPELADYWAWRRRKAPLPINGTALRLHWKQDGRCAICKTALLAASERTQTPRDWEHWLATTRKTIDVVWDTATSDKVEPRLIHLHCNPTASLQGLPEPDARKPGTSGS
jgi:hypothetical protein